jgi:hypothetical protein
LIELAVVTKNYQCFLGFGSFDPSFGSFGSSGFFSDPFGMSFDSIGNGAG